MTEGLQTTSSVLETLIDVFPGWAYCFLLIAAFLVSVGIATFGMRALSLILVRMRRRLPQIL
jgi:hypothetical protein